MSISRIYTNVDAQRGLASLDRNQTELSKVIARLSSGLRIVTAADDPSGAGIAAGLKAQFSGLNQSVSNAETGISMLQTADETMSETLSILSRMRDLAVKAGNQATLTTSDYNRLETEFIGLSNEITRKSTAVAFNTKVLFDGTLSGGVALQVGPDNKTAAMFTITIAATTLTALGIGGVGATFGTDANGNTGTVLIASSTTAGPASNGLRAIDYLQSAINIASNIRANIGVQEVRLESIISDLNNTSVNIDAALSNVQDADMASEISNMARLQVISQANVAMIAQANLQPQQILTLLGSSTGK